MKTITPQEERDAERERVERSVTNAAQNFQQHVRQFGETVRRRRQRREAPEVSEGSSVPPSPR